MSPRVLNLATPLILDSIEVVFSGGLRLIKLYVAYRGTSKVAHHAFLSNVFGVEIA